MRLDEAIDRNVELIGELRREGRYEKANGVSLGNEALKRCEANRATNVPLTHKLLPGETKD